MSDETEAQDLLFFNGINASGEYGLPPMSGDELSGFLKGEAPPENLNELRFRHDQRDQNHYGVREGVDPNDLAEAGWGVIFAHDADPAVREALLPLLELRREQAGDLFKIYEGSAGFRQNEPKNKFLARHGAGPGPADPHKVPYYLLIVGDPEEIPYRFHSQLDVQYAVGRVHFDSVEEYANYAASVVAAERGEVRLPRRASFFGVRNDDDKATSMSARRLIRPVNKYLQDKHADWEANTFLREEATKANLTRLLGGEETPALLFTASHGMEFRVGDSRQVPHQGAILCQDWPGPEAWKGKKITQDFYFAGDDLTRDARLLGLICFGFACYGAGTPHYDEFTKQAFKDTRKEIAPHAFLAGLPKKLLGHPGGGALAFLGHVERAWGYSFLWKGAGTQTAVFESVIDRLLDGHRVGSAFEFFDQRYAELSTMLADDLEEADYGVEVDPYELAGMWTANNDARGYVVLGDPAVKLPAVAGDEEPRARQVIEVRSVDATASAAMADAVPQARSQSETAQVAEAAASGESFGLFGGKSAGEVEAPGPFKEFLHKMGDFLSRTIEDVSTLEVDTWVSSDMEQVSYESGNYRGATMRASTRIRADGDTKLCVPRNDDGSIDRELWALHTEAVKQAQETRAAMIKIAVDAGTSLLGVVKKV